MDLAGLTPRPVTTEQLAVIQDARLRRLAEYWLAKRGSRVIARRIDIDPLEMTWILPHIWLHEIEPGTGRQRCRLAGEEVQAMYATNIVGKYLDEYVLARNWHVIEAHYRQVLESPAIGYASGQVYQAALDQRGHGARLGLPLSDEDGSQIIMLLGATIYKPLPPTLRPPAEGVERIVIPVADSGAGQA